MTYSSCTSTNYGKTPRATRTSRWRRFHSGKTAVVQHSCFTTAMTAGVVRERSTTCNENSIARLLAREHSMFACSATNRRQSASPCYPFLSFAARRKGLSKEQRTRLFGLDSSTTAFDRTSSLSLHVVLSYNAPATQPNSTQPVALNRVTSSAIAPRHDTTPPWHAHPRHLAGGILAQVPYACWQSISGHVSFFGPLVF